MVPGSGTTAVVLKEVFGRKPSTYKLNLARSGILPPKNTTLVKSLIGMTLQPEKGLSSAFPHVIGPWFPPMSKVSPKIVSVVRFQKTQSGTTWVCKP
jgi:hypothetical protein